MRKKGPRFEAVPLDDVLRKLAEGPGEKIAVKVVTKAAPYTLPCKDEIPDPPALSSSRESGLFIGRGSGARQSEVTVGAKNMKRILVVDDEQCIADSLAAILRRSGYEAIAVYDGQSALAECEYTTPDLIISDVIMPGMTGIEMAIQIKQRHAGCKVLLFSGLAASADLLEEARLKGYDFELLAKPIHPAELLEKLAA